MLLTYSTNMQPHSKIRSDLASGHIWAPAPFQPSDLVWFSSINVPSPSISYTPHCLECGSTIFQRGLATWNTNSCLESTPSFRYSCLRQIPLSGLIIQALQAPLSPWMAWLFWSSRKRGLSRHARGVWCFTHIECLLTKHMFRCSSKICSCVCVLCSTTNQDCFVTIEFILGCL